MKLKAIIKIQFLMVLLFSLAVISFTFKPREIYSISGYAQGTDFSIQYTADQPLISRNEVLLLLNQVDSSLSLYKSYSLINQFNASGSGILADSHLLNVVKKGIAISAISDGAFDISVKPLLSLWGFNNNTQHKIPSSRQVNKVLRLVGYQKITIKDSLLSKTNPGLAIDCDGIAQGYSVDLIAALLQKKGIQNYQIELGGEVSVKGFALNDKPWNTRIDMLDNKHLPMERTLHLQDEAITTSGSFSKFSKLGGKYFAHIIDPRLGKPIDNGMISTTVICKDAITADALDNAFMVMGYEKAMSYVMGNTQIGLYMIYRSPDGSLRDTANPYFLKKISPSAEASLRWQ